MSTGDIIIEKQITRKVYQIESKIYESPHRKTEISKISENIKLLSNELDYHKRVSINNSQVNEMISNLFDKDKELLELNGRKSIIHDLDFLNKSPQPKQRKKNLKNKNNQNSNIYLDKKKSLPQKHLYSNISDKNFINKHSLNNNTSKKNSVKNSGFSIFDKSSSLNINNQLNESRESDSIGEEEKEFLKFGFTNKKRIKKNRIRSMENNPKEFGFYEKNLFHKQKRNLAVEMLRSKIHNQNQNEYRENPVLSKNTKEIIKERLSETKPLYQRIDEVMENKSNYIHNLKRFHNNDSKNTQPKDNFNELSNIDNLDYSHFSKNQNISNSVKNNKSNFNNKFLNSNKSPDISANNTFLKMLNDTNIDLDNVTSIPALNTPNNFPNKAKTSENFDNFILERNNNKNNFNNKFNHQEYIEFTDNQKKKQSK